MTCLAGCWSAWNAFILPRPKLLYIFMAMAYYSFYLFRPVFIKKYLGMNDREYGDLASILALVSFIFMTLWGTLADALGRHRLALALASLAMAGSFMLFIVPMPTHTVTFYWSAFVIALYSFFAACILPLTDYQALQMLAESGLMSKDLYGRQRLWATVSYGAITYLISYLIDTLGPETLFVAVPSTATLFSLYLLIFGCRDKPKPWRTIFQRRSRRKPEPKGQAELNDSTTNLKEAEKEMDKPLEEEEGVKHEEIEKQPYSNQVAIHPSPGSTAANTKSPIMRLLSNPNYLFFLLVVFLVGSGRAVMTTFLANYLGSAVKLTNQQIANATLMGLVLEIIILFCGPWLLHHLGIYWMLIGAQVAMTVRAWAYTIIPPQASLFWLFYLVELLKGVAFGLTQSAGVKLSNDTAPEGLQATAQALYTSCYAMLPAVISAFAGGRVYHAFGPNALFLGTSIISTAALGLFIIKYAWDGRITLCGWNPRRPSSV